MENRFAMAYKIVLVPFPFDDLSGVKVRPAVCLTDPIGTHRHVVIAFITSIVPAQLEPTDIPLTPSTPEFSSTGLRVASTLRLHRLVTVSSSLFQRQLGGLPSRIQAQVQQTLRTLFAL